MYISKWSGLGGNKREIRRKEKKNVERESNTYDR